MQPENDVFFAGYHAYRTGRTLRWGAAISAVGMLLLSAGGWLSFRSNEFAATALLLLGLVLLVVGTASLWAWISHRVDRVEISRRGITRGREAWTWDRVTALRIVYVEPLHVHSILLWTRRKRGPGRAFPFDDPLTPEERRLLVSRIKRFLQECGLDVDCQ